MVRPDPVGGLRRLWWRWRDYATALRWQLGGLLLGRDPEAYRRPARPIGPPVVLVPGVYESWHFLRPLAAALHRHGLRVHVVPGLGSNRAAVTAGAAAVGRLVSSTGMTGVVLVAHSKGGLIGKLAMLQHDPDHRIVSMVAVNTPFDGSGMARWIPVRALRAFRPADGTILALVAESEVNARIVAVRSRWDPHIPGRADLVGARNVVLLTPGHFRPLGDPALLELLLSHLLAAEPRPER